MIRKKREGSRNYLLSRTGAWLHAHAGWRIILFCALISSLCFAAPQTPAAAHPRAPLRSSLQAQGPLNPPFPRIYYGTPTETSQPHFSDGAEALILSQFDLLATAGMGAWNAGVAQDVQAINPTAIHLGTSKQGVWPGSDPAQCFVLRSDSAQLMDPVPAGASELRIDSLEAIQKVQISNPERYQYAVIDGRDLFAYEAYGPAEGGYRLSGIPTSGELALDSHEQGAKTKAIIRFPGFGMLHDLTSFAPALPDGRQCWQYFIDNRFELTDFTAFDGVHYDAFRDAFYASDFEEDIDLDRNDVNDLEEHGLDWVNDLWREGVIKAIEYEKQKFAELNPGAPVLYTVNTGHGGDSYLKDHVNGSLFEGFMRFAWNWNHMLESQQAWMQAVEGRGEPFLYAIEDYVKEKHAVEGKNDFAYMRYGLTTTLMGDGYYGRTFGDFFYISLWYDEFNTDLGYPRSGAIKLESHCHQEQDQEEFCVHVRFFDKGVVIVNPTTINQVISDEDLRSLSEHYDGPYYRLLGGQDPAFNNGQLFDQVELSGEAGSREKYNRGDGILLFTEPTTVISDIIVGNHENNDTSPGSRAAQYVGEWDRKLSKGDINPPNPYYSQWNVNYDVYEVYEGSGYSVAPAGNGESYALHRPTIGVPGLYEVFEWHGWHGDTQGSAQEGIAPHEIMHSGGATTVLVDQQSNPGQWNSLGVYTFEQGDQGYVKISNATDGAVISDAIRFAWRGAADGRTFADVPLDHPYYPYIEELYQAGYVAGCSQEPLLYCPERSFTREEMAVFIDRGQHGADFEPPMPPTSSFADVGLERWSVEWIEQLYQDGFTAGCAENPLGFCPPRPHTHAEACVFFLRMQYGADYAPPPNAGAFADVDYEEAWYGDWVDAAWQAGFVEPCATDPELMLCPDDPLSRGEAAYMMFYAKGMKE